MISSRAAALQFLVDLYDPDLGLLPEYHGSKDYWLFHDNYLAVQLLRRHGHSLWHKISRAIQSYGVTASGKIEILFDEAAAPLPFRTPELVIVRTIGDKRIRTELLTAKPALGWEAYADLLLLAAIAERNTRPTAARRNYAKALALWDGLGFADPAFKQLHVYAGYKLALALMASIAVRSPLPMALRLWERLAGLQHASGGFITDYSPNGEPSGVPNIETTCLVLLAMDQYP